LLVRLVKLHSERPPLIRAVNVLHSETQHTGGAFTFQTANSFTTGIAPLA
jgi:hypothetical protein